MSRNFEITRYKNSLANFNKFMCDYLNNINKIKVDFSLNFVLIQNSDLSFFNVQPKNVNLINIMKQADFSIPTKMNVLINSNNSKHIEINGCKVTKIEFQNEIYTLLKELTSIYENVELINFGIVKDKMYTPIYEKNETGISFVDHIATKEHYQKMKDYLKNNVEIDEAIDGKLPIIVVKKIDKITKEYEFDEENLNILIENVKKNYFNSFFKRKSVEERSEKAIKTIDNLVPALKNAILPNELKRAFAKTTSPKKIGVLAMLYSLNMKEEAKIVGNKYFPLEELGKISKLINSKNINIENISDKISKIVLSTQDDPKEAKEKETNILR